MPAVKITGLEAAGRGASSHAYPSATSSRPKRDSGRRHHAYRPVPTNPQLMNGPNIDHTTRSWKWSLVMISRPSASPTAAATAAITRILVRVSGPVRADMGTC
jgi:hypothetical protein